jgi:TonB family protein
MPARVLLANSASRGAFPRWGYLDKYATSEYMARSFALTVLVVMAAMGGWELLPGGARLPVAPPAGHSQPSYTDTAWPMPPPSLMPTPEAIHMSGGGGKVRPRVFIPVPVPGLEADVVPSGGGPGTGPLQEGAFELEPGPIVADIVLPSVPAWPSPDDIVIVEREPQLIAMQPPAYPEIAREAGVEGTVIVRVLVDAQGTVRDRLLLQSVLGLDEAALEAATTAVFRPAMQQDRPVAVWVVLPIEFRLRG